MRTLLQTLAFGCLTLFAALASYAMASFALAVTVTAVLFWGWNGRATVRGQGPATLVFALGMGLIAMSSAIRGLASGPEVDPQAAHDLLVLGLLPVPAGFTACMLGCGLLARAKGRSGWWALIGLGNVIGFGVMLALPFLVPTPIELGSAPSLD